MKLLTLTHSLKSIGLAPPPFKNLFSWQDKNGSLAGQKLQPGRTEMGAWQKIICKTPHFSRFSVIFVCFLTLWVGFYHISLFFFHFWLFCSHSPTKFAHWQNSLAEKLRTAEQNRWTRPPLTGKNGGRKGLILAGWVGWLPSENDPATPMRNCHWECQELVTPILL